MSSITWSAIDWISLVALSIFVLIVARIGEQLSFGNRGVGALMTDGRLDAQWNKHAHQL